MSADAIGGTPGCPNPDCDHPPTSSTLVSFAGGVDAHTQMHQDVFKCECGTFSTRAGEEIQHQDVAEEPEPEPEQESEEENAGQDEPEESPEPAYRDGSLADYS